MQDGARDECFGDLPRWTASPKRPPKDRRVPEEGMLHAGLLLGGRHVLPPTASDLLDLLDRAIASARPRPPARHGGWRGWRNHDLRITCARVTATVAYATVAVTRAMSPTTASIRSVPVVASSTFASVKAWAMITPDPSTPKCRVFQPRLPRPPCFPAAHAPSPTIESPVLSTMRGVPAPAGARRTVGSRC